ncbi:MAG: helix-turn-helix domain-containing protein, partial [Pseudomonadota bacterium]
MQAINFVESYFDAWNHWDPEGVADHLATNGIHRDIPENTQRTHDELVSVLADFFSKYRHSYELIGEILAHGETIAFQYEMIPTKRERSSIKYSGAEFITMSDEVALTITDYYDVDKHHGTWAEKTPLTAKAIGQRKYAKSGLCGEQLLAYQHRLENIMQSEQFFLQPDLTLPRLAKAVDCSVNHLSQVINSGFGMSFFDYLNNYRIDYAKKLLGECREKNSAILDVAFTVGFNSNSAFYSAFKKIVGQTPAQFRRDRQL